MNEKFLKVTVASAVVELERKPAFAIQYTMITFETLMKTGRFMLLALCQLTSIEFH